MTDKFIEGNWYEIRLPYGKVFTARYEIDPSSGEEWFYFSDGSGKLVKDIVPFASDISHVEDPVLEQSIIDFLDDEDEV